MSGYICQPSGRSGSSICRRKPAGDDRLDTPRRIASAVASTKGLLVRVVLVSQPVFDSAGSVSGQEGLHGPDVRQGRLEILEVLFQRRAPDVLERRDAHGELPAL